MKAISVTLFPFLILVAFFNIVLANIETEVGPDGQIASVKYTPDGDSLRKRAPKGNSDCAQWCAANFPNPGSDCTSLAAHGHGPCYICGPRKSSPTQVLCGGECRDTSSDPNNCGGCGNVCTSTNGCQNSQCLCGGPGSPCTLSNFVQACCAESAGIQTCFFINGDPNNGYCG